MKKVILFLLFTAVALAGQSAPSGTLTASGGTTSNCYNATTGFTPSVSCAVLPNVYGGPANSPLSISLEETFSGSPASVSIVAYGCMKSGTCSAALDTNTGTSNAVRSISLSQPYSVILVVASTLSGGTSPSVTINAQATMALKPGGAGSGVLSINSVTGAFTFSGSGVSCITTTCTFSGTGSGVTSVGLSVPSWLTVANSPVTSSGVLTVTPATGQTSHEVIGTCGSGTTFAPCTLVPGDLPTIPSTQISGLGTFATQNYATPPAIGGTTPAAGTFTTLAANTSLALPTGPVVTAIFGTNSEITLYTTCTSQPPVSGYLVEGGTDGCAQASGIQAIQAVQSALGTSPGNFTANTVLEGTGSGLFTTNSPLSFASSSATAKGIFAGGIQISGFTAAGVVTSDGSGNLSSILQGTNVNPQTGNYTFNCATDRLGEIEFNISAAATLSLPQAGSTTCTGSNMFLIVRNTSSSSASLTVSATTSLFEPAATSTITHILPDSSQLIFSDATTGTGNYHAIQIPSGYGGVNSQTSSYTAVDTDKDKLIVVNSSSACVITLPSTPPTSRWNTNILSIGSTLCTVSLNGLNFNGAATAPTLVTGVITPIRTDGSNYFGTLSPGTTVTIASGAQALGIASIASQACATVVTVSASGVASTDTVSWSPNASIKAVTGYAPLTTGGLSIAAYPTANNVNFDVCNWSASSITPGAVTLNWRVTR